MPAENKEIELKDEIYNNILELTETGDEYYEEGELKKAEKAYLEVLELLPEPKDESNKNFEAVHFYDEINIAYKNGDYNKALELLNKKWEEIPLPKEKHKESPHILRKIIEILLIKHDYIGAKKVCADYFDYDFFMNGFGEGYLLSGKIFYELGSKEDIIINI
jgi:tetratricopeptide (TPR) repeat protein